MSSGSRGAVFQNLRVTNLDCDFLRIDHLLRIAGRALGTADLVNSARFITRNDLVQADYAETDTDSLSYIQNKPILKAVAFSADYNELVNLPELKSVAFSADYNDLVNKPALPGGPVMIGDAAFGSFTCTGPLIVGPEAGIGNAVVPRGVRIYVSEGYDGAGGVHSIGDARIDFNSNGDNFVGFCRVYVKNLQSGSTAAKTGFISFMWFKLANKDASDCSTLIATKNTNMATLNVKLVGNYPTVYTDSDCLTSWCIEIGG